MSPKQHYLPFFFDLKDFINTLGFFGLSSYTLNDDKIQMLRELMIVKGALGGSLNSRPCILTIPFGMTMLFLDHDLLFWDTGYYKINIYKARLNQSSINYSILHYQIDISELVFSHNNVHLEFEVSNFAAFLRMETLNYDRDYYEQFVIILIEIMNYK